MQNRNTTDYTIHQTRKLWYVVDEGYRIYFPSLAHAKTYVAGMKGSFV